MNLVAEMKRIGFTPDQIARVTYKGRPVSEYQTDKSRLPMKRPELSDTFVALWKQYGLPIEPVREFRFHPTRRWRFDVAFFDYKVAVELEGGQWIKSRHRTGTGYHKDAAKYNAAVALGWRILRFVTNDLDLDPLGTITQVADLIQHGVPAGLWPEKGK